MLKTPILIFTLITIIPLISTQGANFTSSEAPILKIDLRKKPFERWSKIPLKQCNTLKSFEPVLTKYLKNVLGDFYNKFENFFKNRDYSRIREFHQEMLGISSTCKINLEFIMMLNYIYEFETVGCTSIIFQNEDKMTLATNLDYNFPDFYADLTMKVQYYRGNPKNIFFEANQMIGFLGFSRGFRRVNRRKVIMFSLNARQVKRRQYYNRTTMLKKLQDTNNLPIIFQLRKILEKNPNYSQISHQFRSIHLLAPCYLILTDGYNSMNLERNPEGFDDEYHAGIEQNDWFLVQTNLDTKIKNIKDPRREAPLAFLRSKKRGQVSGEQIMEYVLRKGPNWFEYVGRGEDKKLVRTISSTYVSEAGEFKVFVYKKKEVDDDEDGDV